MIFKLPDLRVWITNTLHLFESVYGKRARETGELDAVGVIKDDAPHTTPELKPAS